MLSAFSTCLTSTLVGLAIGLASACLPLAARDEVIDHLRDKEALEVMIEDTTGELARNQASLDQIRSVHSGLGAENAADHELGRKITEHIAYYESLIAGDEALLLQLRERRQRLEEEEKEQLRQLVGMGNPYLTRERMAFLDRILAPGSSRARFGESGKTRMEAADAELFAAIGDLQGRLNEERSNRQEAANILLDKEANVNTIVDMQQVSQGYFDERFVLYDKMNQTYEQIRRWRPDLAPFFRPPPEPKAPEAYKRALERMQKQGVSSENP